MIWRKYSPSYGDVRIEKKINHRVTHLRFRLDNVQGKYPFFRLLAPFKCFYIILPTQADLKRIDWVLLPTINRNFQSAYLSEDVLLLLFIMGHIHEKQVKKAREDSRFIAVANEKERGGLILREGIIRTELLLREGRKYQEQIWRGANSRINRDHEEYSDDICLEDI